METYALKTQKNKLLENSEETPRENPELIEEINLEKLTVKYFKRKYGIVFPGPSALGIKKFQCSKYARKIANLEGFFINPAHAWNLTDKNPSEDYKISNLKKGSLVLFYSAWSRFNKIGRIGTHVGYYLGKDLNGEPYFIQQLKVNKKILSENQMKKKGFFAKKIISSKKF